MGLFSFWRKKSTPYAGTPYMAIGGEPAVRQLTNRFYDIMSSDPSVEALYALHPQPLDNIRHVFYLYLSMWLGGPATYTEERGHPRLRARHMPFEITPELKEQWMYCMRKAMYDTVPNLTLARRLLADLDALATHMVNTEQKDTPPPK